MRDGRQLLSPIEFRLWITGRRSSDAFQPLGATRLCSRSKRVALRAIIFLKPITEWRSHDVVFRCYARDPSPGLHLGPASWTGMHGSADHELRRRSRVFLYLGAISLINARASVSLPMRSAAMSGLPPVATKQRTSLRSAISRLPFSENRRIADDKNVNGSRTWLAVCRAKVVTRKQVL